MLSIRLTKRYTAFNIPFQEPITLDNAKQLITSKTLELDTIIGSTLLYSNFLNIQEKIRCITEKHIEIWNKYNGPEEVKNEISCKLKSDIQDLWFRLANTFNEHLKDFVHGISEILYLDGIISPRFFRIYNDVKEDMDTLLDTVDSILLPIVKSEEITLMLVNKIVELKNNISTLENENKKIEEASKPILTQFKSMVSKETQTENQLDEYPSKYILLINPDPVKNSRCTII
jgi:hypothetical protein